MRNILTVLMLFVLTLTTSSVFAEKFDESKRTERFGLSFYDGAPMYYVNIKLNYENDDLVDSLSVDRLRTGDNIADLDRYFEYGGYVLVDAPTTADMLIYGYDDSGSLTLLDSGKPGVVPSSILKYVKINGPGALAMARLGAGDLAVETYDEIAPEAQAWARRGIMLAVLLLALSAGLNKFRELTSGGASTSETDAKAGSLSATIQESREERATMRKIHDAAMMGNLGGGLDERFLSETERREHDFITGKAFGLTFDDKVRASNKLFLESFNRLSQYEQEALLQEWRVSSYTESYQGSVERRFIDWREGSAYDGATSHKQTDAFDNWFSSDPFNGGDEDGEPPF